MTNTLQKHHAALARVSRNAEAIYDILDSEKGPVKVAVIQERLKIGAHDYRLARQHLTAVIEGVYITSEGLVLQKYLRNAEQRFWHLAWCLGLLEISGQQLTMDEDLLRDAPAALMRMWNRGQLSDYKRLSLLQTNARKRIATLLNLAEMYRRIDQSLNITLLPKTLTSKDWHDGLRQIKKQLAAHA